MHLGNELCRSVSNCRLFALQSDQLNTLRAPMPGVVKALDCSVGETVEEGTPLVTLEAMKMQNPLFAPKTGKVGEDTFTSRSSFSLWLCAHIDQGNSVQSW